MIFYSDLLIHNAVAKPTVVHPDTLTVYAYQDELFYCNDSQVHHKLITDKDLANPLIFSGGLLQLNYNTTNLKVDSGTNTLNTIQDIALTSSPVFANLALVNTESNSNGAWLAFSKTRLSSYPSSGDTLGSFNWQSLYNKIGASFYAHAAQNWNANALGTQIILKTCANDSSTLIERLAVLSNGAIRFNNAYTFPTSDGSAQQALITDGSGALYFATISGGSSKWSWTDLVLNSYLLPSDDSHINIAAKSFSNTIHSKFAFLRASNTGSFISDAYILGEHQYLGVFNSSTHLLASQYAIFNVVSDTKYTTFFFKNAYFDSSNNKTTFTCLELNHEKAAFLSPQITLYDQIIQRASSNIFYLPYNAQAAYKLFYASSNTQTEWKSVSEVLTSAFGTPSAGSVIFHNGTTWTAYHPSGAPSVGNVLGWNGTSPNWSANAAAFTEISISNVAAQSISASGYAEYEFTVAEGFFVDSIIVYSTVDAQDVDLSFNLEVYQQSSNFLGASVSTSHNLAWSYNLFFREDYILLHNTRLTSTFSAGSTSLTVNSNNRLSKYDLLLIDEQEYHRVSSLSSTTGVVIFPQGLDASQSSGKPIWQLYERKNLGIYFNKSSSNKLYIKLENNDTSNARTYKVIVKCSKIS